MTLHLRPPAPTFEQLRAQAASGSSGVAKRAQAQLRAATTAGLRKAIANDQ